MARPDGAPLRPASSACMGRAPSPRHAGEIGRSAQDAPTFALYRAANDDIRTCHVPGRGWVAGGVRVACGKRCVRQWRNRGASAARCTAFPGTRDVPPSGRTALLPSWTRAENRGLLESWMAAWSDVVAFEVPVIEVMSSADAAALYAGISARPLYSIRSCGLPADACMLETAGCSYRRQSPTATGSIASSDAVAWPPSTSPSI